MQGDPLLTKVAENAIMHWRYRSALLNGVPVESEIRIVVDFVAER